MEVEGRIAGTGDVGIQPWQPETELQSLVLNDVRLSRGFLRAEPMRWFPALGTHWRPFLLSLGIEESKCSFEVGLEFPSGLDRIIPTDVDGEIAVIGMDNQTQALLVGVVAAGMGNVASELVIEYLERRLLSSLTKCWGGPGPLVCSYISPDITESVEVIGVVSLNFEIAGKSGAVHFGLGPKLVERLDSAERERTVKQGSAKYSEDIYAVSVEIAQLAVPPAMLIDYLRGGTVIDLELPVSEQVNLRLNGELWARGRLCHFNGRFAVEIVELEPEPLDHPASTTRVQVEVARVELTKEGLAEHGQLGVVLLTRTPIGGNASLIISGENVASAVIGQINGNFAVNVLPK